MHVLITGGAGFIGLRLAQAILEKGALVDQFGERRDVERLTLFDIAEPPTKLDDARVRVVVGDITDRATLRDVIGPEISTVFHTAGVVSGGAEADLQLGLKVNLDGTRLLLDLLADTGRKPKLIFASSCAVYAGPKALNVTDDTVPTPMGSYGAQKLCAELLIGDYDRRGLIDGRSLRLPNIAVRPGKANLAIASFISNVIREPLAGRETINPVLDDIPIALLSPGRLIEAILKVHDMASTEFGWPRSLLLPAVQVTLRQMLDALETIAGKEVRDRVKFQPDDRAIAMIKGRPASVTSERAAALGIEADKDAYALVEQYAREQGVLGAR